MNATTNQNSVTEEEEEMGFVSHKAIESRLRGPRISAQVAEMKRKQRMSNSGVA